jgi:hypothetical protein
VLAKSFRSIVVASIANEPFQFPIKLSSDFEFGEQQISNAAIIMPDPPQNDRSIRLNLTDESG